MGVTGSHNLEEALMEHAKTAKPECDQPWVGDLNELVQFADRGIVNKTLVECPRPNWCSSV